MKKFQDYYEGIHLEFLGKKTIRVMKLSLLLTLLTISQLWATEAYSQITKLSLKLDNVKISDALMAIEDQSEFFFLYSPKLVDVERRVDIDVKNEPITDILTEIFDEKVQFAVYDRQIILSPADQPVKSLELQQQTQITGTVTDSRTGDPLPGVTVLVKGTTVGTISENDGSYNIPVAQGSAALVFSFIGYQKQEIAIGTQTVINAVMVEEVTALSELIVVGYGTKTKSSVTGAISTVGKTELENISVTNVAGALTGKVSGAFITSEGGRPGSGSNIYLRGPVSISGGNPLYVVDGVPMADLSYGFNMVDIESISVLKDASAAAIYGATAAGGVILVTTKRGQKSKPQVSFDASYGTRNAIVLPEIFKRDDYIAAKALAGYDVEDLFGPQSGWSSLPDTDWFDEWYNPGSEQNYTLSMNGGGETSTFYLSGNYNKIVGNRLENWIERYTFRINSDHQITKRLKFSENIYFKTGSEDPPSIPEEGYQTLRSIPIMPVYDENNPNGGWGMTPKGFQGRNYVAAALTEYARNKDYTINMSGALEYTIIKDLLIKAFMGATLGDLDAYVYQYPYSDGSWTKPENFSKSNSKAKQYIGTYTLNYNRDFGGHSISGLLGYEWRSSYYSNLLYSNRDSYVAIPQSSNVAVGITSLSSTFNQTDALDRILSQFARVEYDYKDKYLLTANIRRDGYGSKFGPENRYGIFPGISLGWVISKENFMSQVSFINLLKLRAGYGVLGNAVGPNFAYTRYYEPGYNFDWSEQPEAAKRETGLQVVSKLANPEIQWESVATANIGIDASFWSGRLAMSIDFYSRQTKDMLYDVPVALSAGVGATVQANIGQMSNTGLEFQIEHQNNVGDFSYSITMNGGFNKNELISLNPDLERLFISSGNIGAGESGGGFYGGAAICRSEPGQPLGQFYGLQTAGIYANDAATGETRPTYSGYIPRAGDLIYVDQNTDGVINASDMVYIGNPWPKFTYGLAFGGGWKNIEVKLQFSGSLGNDVYNGFDSYEYNFFSDYNSTAKIYDASFFGDNGLTSVPRSATLTVPDRNKNWGAVSDYHIQSGSYMRLRNLQISYALPADWLTRMRISNMKVFFSADNLLVLTGYKGLDPEIPAQGGSILAQGIDFTSPRYPLSRVVSFGVNMTF